MQHLVEWSQSIESWLLSASVRYETFIVARLYSLFLCVLCFTLFVKQTDCVCQCLMKNYLTCRPNTFLSQNSSWLIFFGWGSTSRILFPAEIIGRSYTVIKMQYNGTAIQCDVKSGHILFWVVSYKLMILIVLQRLWSYTTILRYRNSIIIIVRVATVRENRAVEVN